MNQPRAARNQKQQRANHDVWHHDKFSESTTLPRRALSGSAGDAQVATEVGIDGLHYEVTQSDLMQLFRPIGAIARGPEIKYDVSGRSTGKASVWYYSNNDAQSAVKEFNHAKAKGQTIAVYVIGPRRMNDSRPRKERNPRQPSLMERLSVAGHRSGAHRNRTKKNRDTNRDRRRLATTSELDAELDAFMNASASPKTQEVC
ncbi:hypothetical protein MPSI1_001996 [Malassezia psittaci]|uniref:RRM domain-containing protein n=1 Tax=Malassezia psittaci TaxID=1821823 RepID=A0AAF0JE92_9BASI|nr:hypothetical protein MPSI1_001996 [Malassezia psittaci]